MLPTVILLLLLLFPGLAIAAGPGQAADTNHLGHYMTLLVLQVAVIITAARLGNNLIRRLRMPPVLGELIAGMLIGPYLLGAIPLPGLAHGLFPLPVNGHLPVSPELYGLATIGSIILLFTAGLETDIKMFLRFSLAGSLVGIGGVVFTFALGIFTGMWLWDTDFLDPGPLFLGVMSTATSVGVSTRILSDRRKMDSPEGVTIMAGAVIDDILGIILLAVILGYCFSIQQSGSIAWSAIGFIALKAVLVWVGITAAGLALSRRLSAFLKRARSEQIMTIIAFAMALLLAGLFELLGLAMIIGAFVMGLIFANTDLQYLLHERLRELHLFFVPLLFTVMGMLIDVRILFEPAIVIPGSIYALGAIIAKLFGCALPALLLNFNFHGALRVALGMVPRCEVILIIAGVGLSHGFIDKSIFGAAVILIFMSMLTAPPALNHLLKSSKEATRSKMVTDDRVVLNYRYPSAAITEIFVQEILKHFREQNFFVTTNRLDVIVHRIGRDHTSISMFQEPLAITIKIAADEVQFTREIVFQVYASVGRTFERMEWVERPS